MTLLGSGTQLVQYSHSSSPRRQSHARVAASGTSSGEAASRAAGGAPDTVESAGAVAAVVAVGLGAGTVAEGLGEVAGRSAPLPSSVRLGGGWGEGMTSGSEVEGLGSCGEAVGLPWSSIGWEVARGGGEEEGEGAGEEGGGEGAAPVSRAAGGPAPGEPEAEVAGSRALGSLTTVVPPCLMVMGTTLCSSWRVAGVSNETAPFAAPSRSHPRLQRNASLAAMARADAALRACRASEAPATWGCRWKSDTNGRLSGDAGSTVLCEGHAS